MPYTTEDLTGSVLREYVVLERVGEGTTASVYRALDSANGNRMVALKVMHAVEQRLRHRSGQTDHPFEREQRLIRAIDDPRLVRTYDVGQLDDGRFYMAMEFVSGRALADELQARGASPWHEALGVWVEILAAVGSFHRMHVIHRDISPSNIMLRHDTDGKIRVKLIDFGLARLQHERDDDGSSKGLGTPLYMAPEQAQGLGTSARSDVYSLAAVFYEMVSGRPVIPLKRPSSHACVAYLESTKPLPAVPLKVLIPNVIPPGLERLVMDCLDRHPARRADDAMDLEARARRYLVTNNEPAGPSRRRGIHRILGALFGRREKQGGGFRRNE